MLRVGWVRWLVALAIASVTMSGSALACTVTAKAPLSAGPFSPIAVAGGKVPTIVGQGGLKCDAGVLTLFGGNYLRATFTTLNGSTINGLKLKNGTKELPYTAFADAGGTVGLTHGATIDYMQNNLLNLLGLLGPSNAALPLYIKPGAAAGLPYGTYTDTITIAWDWRICSLAYVLGACVGSLDKDTGSTEIVVSVEVGPQDMTITLSSMTTWDAVRGTNRPLAVPGSKGRASLLVSNPDLVPLDGGSIALIYQVPPRTSVALDGDGATASPIIGFTDGSPASGSTLNYTQDSAVDDVDFSADGGATWNYSPSAGNRASEAAVTHLRFRPRGAMNAKSSFTVTIPYLVR